VRGILSASFAGIMIDALRTDRTVIPSSVTTLLSVRIVPDQDLAQIAEELEQHIRESFANLRSPNSLEVRF